ncbi:hypothetical protein MSG28_009580 [Choristoneura fumiferana]|uniref:Uncharacterized protein n=1 Tax=Choristoneura fumiferana TaxID=7141 RepID=A0ACC0JBR5_CHOFU|nr:hypothetical protein MSG28_009580 [Choristoneura fumiferana]
MRSLIARVEEAFVATKGTTLRSKENVKRNKKNCNQECKVRKYGREFYCDICDYKTVYRSTYQRHLLTHENPEDNTNAYIAHMLLFSQII